MVQGNKSQVTKSQVTWGPKLFVTVMVLALVFFWWLLMYSHGVAVPE